MILIQKENYLSSIPIIASQEQAHAILFSITIIKIAYLICELNSTIEVLIYDGVGEFERMQVISTLPDGYEGFNGTAAIRLSKDGKYLYASNRGHDSIVVYTILADGSLELLEIVPTHGQTPRDFDLTPDQEVCHCCPSRL